MRGQLSHLADIVQQGKTTVQVVPYWAGAHAGTTGPFVILDFDEPTDPAVVYVETVRDSKDASGPVLVFGRHAWSEFAAKVKAE